MSSESEILTVEEAADYLKINKKSMYKLARDGNVPGRKVLSKWRFTKQSLQKWVENKDQQRASE